MADTLNKSYNYMQLIYLNEISNSILDTNIYKGKYTKMKWLKLMQNYDVVEYKQSTLIAVFGS